MPMPPALAAALAAKSGKKKSSNFSKKPAGDNGIDSMMNDGPNVASLAGAAKAKLAAPKPGAKKKGNVPPQFLK